MSQPTLSQRLAGLSSAEEFFQELEVPFEPKVLNSRRLHVLQRYHDLLAEPPCGAPDDRERHRAALAQAYAELSGIEPREAKLFKVFKQPKTPAGRGFVGLSTLTK
ncbi:nitrogenase-stabilizing/protective protein NifW [Roseospirillum parvum]|uniref:Nitrogenase-stabilizing/protective protein NifW n=1 Tax=Roseospirillum parvum TaxID=83401 RepID=A0A1G8GAH2_9PROT|nr:nitrogenase-stabilizing/protective protein NifW [Roseospirillum parvum]SDH91428.1 nitrogenase-stabilizing/protective protein [Roseospirillum parvum]